MQTTAERCLASSAGEPVPEAGTACSNDASAPVLRRVVYVVSQFPCFSETFIVREINALIDEGVDVRILALKAGNEPMVQADAASLLGRVHQPPGVAGTLAGAAAALIKTPVKCFATVAKIVRDTWRQPAVMVLSLGTAVRAWSQLAWINRFEPQFIHAHWSTYPTTAAWALSQVTGKPFGFTSHAHDVFRNHHLLPRKIADAALAVTISQHNVDWLARNISPLASRKLNVVHCGVDLRHIAWQPKVSDANRILGVARLAPEKGFRTLLEALALLRDRGTRFECKIIGDGPDRDELSALIERNDLGELVELAGAQPQEAVREALANATVFALPCEIAPNGSRDGIPVALMEAMAAGCPVVSCPVSGIPELITDDVNGLLAREQDPVSLANALERLLKDPMLRRRFSGAARKRIESEFDAQCEARKLHELIRGVIDEAA